MGKRIKKYATFLPEEAEKYIYVYWGYYTSIENEYNRIYATKDVDKYSEVRLYLAIGSEIDVVFKTICQLLNNTYYGDNIDDHKKEIQKNIDFGDWDDYHEEISYTDGTSLKPWNNTSWWTDYNNVKHKRTCLDNNNDLFFSHANKNNILNALAALFILERQLYIYMEGFLLYEEPKMKKCQSTLFK